MYDKSTECNLLSKKNFEEVVTLKRKLTAHLQKTQEISRQVEMKELKLIEKEAFWQQEVGEKLKLSDK